MGNFHCIPSSCARVVWREYLPPTIRWRYPGEDWQEIEGDDHSIDDQSPQFDYLERKQYKVFATARVLERVPPASSGLPAIYEKDQEIEVYLLGTYSAPIWGIELIAKPPNAGLKLTYTTATGGNLLGGYCEQKTITPTLYTQVPNFGNTTVRLERS